MEFPASLISFKAKKYYQEIFSQHYKDDRVLCCEIITAVAGGEVNKHCTGNDKAGRM